MADDRRVHYRLAGQIDELRLLVDRFAELAFGQQPRRPGLGHQKAVIDEILVGAVEALGVAKRQMGQRLDLRRHRQQIEDRAFVGRIVGRGHRDGRGQEKDDDAVEVHRAVLLRVKKSQNENEGFFFFKLACTHVSVDRPCGNESKNKASSRHVQTSGRADDVRVCGGGGGLGR